MQGHLYRQFSSPGHRGVLNDIPVTFIDEADESDSKNGKNTG